MKTGFILVCGGAIPNGKEHGIKGKLFVVVSRGTIPKKGNQMERNMEWNENCHLRSLK